MKLYRVSEYVQDGFLIQRIAGQRPCISLGVDGSLNAPMCLPLSSTLCDAVSHPDDVGLNAVLNYAKFTDTTAGLMLSAIKDGQLGNTALVLLTHSKSNGYTTEVSVANGHTRPELVSTVSNPVSRCDLVLFHPGDGLKVFWDRRMFDPPEQAVRFTVAWDGADLVTVHQPVIHSVPAADRSIMVAQHL